MDNSSIFNIVKFCSEKFGFRINKVHVKNHLKTMKTNFGVVMIFFMKVVDFAGIPK